MAARPLRLGAAFLVAATGTCVAEVFLGSVLLTQAWDLPTVLGTHAALTALLALWTAVSPAARADLRLPLLLTTTTALLGPFGATGTLLAAGLSRLYARTATPFEEWHAMLFPDEADADARPRTAAGSIDAAHGSVAPFADILAFGTTAQKQELITLIGNEFQPEFAPVLRLALNDSNPSIRVQAASAVTRIEDDFLRRSVELAKAAHARPRDAVRLLALAAFHDEYASADIFDAARARESRQEASRAYRAYLERVPGDYTARAAVGRLLLQDGRAEEAAAWLTPVLDDADARPHVVPLLMDAQYRLGRFAEVRRVAAAAYAEMRARDDVPLVTLETMRLWAGAAG